MWSADHGVQLFQAPLQVFLNAIYVLSGRKRNWAFLDNEGGVLSPKPHISVLTSALNKLESWVSLRVWHESGWFMVGTTNSWCLVGSALSTKLVVEEEEEQE